MGMSQNPYVDAPQNSWVSGMCIPSKYGPNIFSVVSALN